MKLNTEKVLRLLNEMGTLEEIREIGTWQMINAWGQLHEYVTEALHYEIANKKGGKAEEVRRKTALKLLKDSKIEKASGKHWRGNSWVVDGCQYFSDGNAAYRFAEGHHIEGLPQIVPGVDCNVPPNIGTVLDQVLSTTSEAPVTRAELEMSIVTWKAEGKQAKWPEIKIGKSSYNAEIILTVLKILGVDEASIKQRSWQASGHIYIEGRTAAFMPIAPAGGDVVYKMLDNGAFVCGDTKQRITGYVHPGNPSAGRARENPEVVASEILRRERDRRDILEPTEADVANWKLLELENVQQLCA